MCENQTVSKKNFKRGSLKTLLMILAVSLIICGVVGGTVAWLITKTAPVVNTFTYGDVNITLDETDTDDGDGDTNTNTYTMVPGNTITKDPKVTVLADSEDSWLFVKLDKSTDPNFDAFMQYEIADGWTALEGTTDVYYREVSQADTDAAYYIIKDNAVTVKGDVTKEMLNALTAYPTLTVTAYAVQRDADIDAIDTAAEAWALAIG